MNKYKEYKQKVLQYNLFEGIKYTLIIMFVFSIIILGISEKNKIEDENKVTGHETVYYDFNQDTVVSSANVLNNGYLSKWNEDESYLLAKIAMAEAEGESIKTKVLIILTVLNRVNSKDFPNTINEVIFEKNKSGLHQFSCIVDGRWDRVEPNEECYLALEIVSEMKKDILSGGALYFEACEGESWHSRNLELIQKSDSTRFYK